MYHMCLAAVTLSLDNTFKISNKLMVKDRDKTYTKLLKGGVLSVLNQKNDIVAWVGVKQLQDEY